MMWWILISLALGIWTRTISWHLAIWQRQEYRLDRYLSYWRTAEGKSQRWKALFFRGIFPRPKLTGRVIFILFLILGLITLGAVGAWFLGIQAEGEWFLLIILAERLSGVLVALAVQISQLPVRVAREVLFWRAKILRGKFTGTVIAITGSYGKSSTKELIAHFLRGKFGEAAVCATPENQNTEVSIARHLLRHAAFLTASSKSPRFLVIEVGAYRRGEIAKVGKFLLPDIGVITAAKDQHLELFGSAQNIILGKFELAQASRQVAIFNADDEGLKQQFSAEKLSAQVVGVSDQLATEIKSDLRSTSFRAHGQQWEMPWGGRFWVKNVLLGLAVCEAVGIKMADLVPILKRLAPEKKTFSVTQKAGVWWLVDGYSSNPAGVLAAIEQLKKCAGKRWMIAWPLRELGERSESAHQEIFSAVKSADIELYWLQDDWAQLGEHVLGKNFHRLSTPQQWTELKQQLRAGDGILLEGRLPKWVA